jgi:20S proteasome alpha/beta subunit
VKRLAANKLLKGDTFVVAGAGVIAHVKNAFDTISAEIDKELRQRQEQPLGKDECVTLVEKTVTALHKYYNIGRAQFLGVDEKGWFAPLLLFAYQAPGGAILLTVHPEGLVEEVDDYATIGSGAAYAELLLKALYSDGLDANAAINIAIYVITEVKDIDPNCGGPVQIAVVSEKNLQLLSREEIDDRLESSRKPLDAVRNILIPKILKGEVNAADIARLGTG